MAIRKFKREKRTCTFPGCVTVFECEQRSNRQRCDGHTQVNLGKAANQAAADKVAAQMFKERTQEYLDQYIPLPPVPEHISATRIEDMGFDTPQEGVALFSDYHFGSLIDPRVAAGLARYNPVIARDRMALWRTGILRFTQMLQVLMPLNVLNIFALGDEIEGHGQMFGSQALQMAMSSAFQVRGFIDDMSGVLCDLLSRYDRIRVYKVPGNHGRITARAKDSYPPDNLEIMAWRNIADRVRAATGQGEWSVGPNGIEQMQGGPIEVYLSPSELMFVKVLGWKFLLRHGHGIGGIAKTYTGALDNKRRLNSIIGETVHYYVKAHLHEAQSAENEIQGMVIQNGCFVGPSLLSLMSNMAAANLPSQDFLAIHPKRGLTHHHRIHLATTDEIRAHEWIGE